ncbi:hypothetical protein IE81DRAFT_346883 [Ceraceosorus guamensis]|uniref:Uncharacterized protein n=1 Tax=Ceraceosorus guamensis TaxID=1522189 RepID=A0A316W032_9BASI|nr:hypothetical protein IE81DRAFT_346883 [Ceraceosorus guamensis]PWN43092.1 hypothetical protein IE81DRAFT_346883 [Ceraceosorus guamensis]
MPGAAAGPHHRSQRAQQQPTGSGGIKMPPPRTPPKQLWSNRTLLFLTTCVGGVTYVLGINTGYEAGKKKAFEDLTGGQRKPSAPLGEPVSPPSQSQVPQSGAASRPPPLR